MANSDKGSKVGGYIFIVIIFLILWGIPSMIRGEGFLNGIMSNLKAGIALGAIALIGYAILEKK